MLQVAHPSDPGSAQAQALLRQQAGFAFGRLGSLWHPERMIDEPQDPHIFEPGHAPTPFTAEEIRDGCPTGRTIRLRVDAAGETPFLRVSRFVECDEIGATMERSQLALDGSPLGEPDIGRVSWSDLQGHASFPTEITTIEPERIESPIGELDCLRYTVRDGDTDAVFWFAKDLPGMPIQYLTRNNSNVVMKVSVVDNTIL